MLYELIMIRAIMLSLSLAVLMSTTSTASPLTPLDGVEGRPDVFGDDVLRGFDCTQPRNVKDVGYVGEPDCASDSKVVSARNASYQVLQEEKYYRVNGTTCAMTVTRVVRYCGTYDHQTALPPANLYEVATPVPEEMCRKWYRTEEFKDNHNEKYPLRKNAINTIHYEEVGRTYTSDNGEISCEGGDWKWGKKLLHRIVVEIQVKITLREESYLLNKQETIAHVENVRLPCPASANQCEMPTRTYLWVAPDLECKLAVARAVHGTEAQGEKGEKVFVSTDGSLVRLIRQEAVSMCGRVVHSTNYAGIYLYEQEKPRPFVRPIEAGEVSLTLYIKNRDDFLYDNIVTALEEEFRGILTSDCQSRSQRLKRDFWEQHQRPGATTWLVADDVFATAAGDVIYQYQCQSVLVRAVTLGQCYQALPVRLVQPRSDNAAEAARQLYLEPLTRRLTHQGIEVPCSRLFRPKYRNTQGNWLVAAPEIIAATSPRLPPTLEAHREIFQSRPDWSVGGIYTDETLEAAERYQEFSRTSAAIGAVFARQAGSEWREAGGGTLSAEQIFPEFRDPGKWVSNAWARTRGILHAWGEGAAIIFSLFALGRIVTNILSWLYGVAVLKEMMGCTRHLVWTLCPNIFLLRQYRQFNRAQQTADVSAPPAEAPVVTVDVPKVSRSRAYKPEDILAAAAGGFMLSKPPARVDRA